ncbi:hypothetical protein IVB12_32365 [Bradyrhizobium sp. 179]|uniref:hypothetical protein n=1 Tax=Bradyrhizobium sp. 179 TaxID=2782648 RepID=UPI001FFA0F25|nr:hypothetical protein [Bradyrhizobium sp. 179]MCK1546493.1 hypothetical protein [Bradyrhizobium sp. 179]
MGAAECDGPIGLDVLLPRCTSTRVGSLGEPLDSYIAPKPWRASRVLGVVKPLGEDDEALMEPERKLSHMRSDTLHSLSATLGVVKLLGEDDEALMEGGRKPCHTSES